MARRSVCHARSRARSLAAGWLGLLHLAFGSALWPLPSVPAMATHVAAHTRARLKLVAWGEHWRASVVLRNNRCSRFGSGPGGCAKEISESCGQVGLVVHQPQHCHLAGTPPRLRMCPLLS